MLWLADCLENQGLTASSWATFKAAAAGAARRRDGRERVARSRAAQLEATLSMQIRVVAQGAAVPGLEIAATVLGQAEWAVPVPLDPGSHTNRRASPGTPSLVHDLSIPPGPSTLYVTIPVLDAEPPATTPALREAEVQPRVPATAPPATVPTQRIPGVALVGAGCVPGGERGLGAGLQNGLRRFQLGLAPPLHSRQPLRFFRHANRSAAKSSADAATVAFGAGIAAIAGDPCYFTAPRALTPQVTIAATPRGACIEAALRF